MKKKTYSHANFTLRTLLLGIGISVLGTLTFSLTGCDTETNNNDVVVPGKVVFKGKHNADNLTFTIIENVNAKATL